MKSKKKESAISDNNSDSAPKTPYVFLSHDTRDAEVAELFAKLLASVTAGVLKCFRSSDKRGTQGIEYGVEWFPELMKRLKEASDVVCILTENSVNRPWILFEAGVAKGKLDTPILGLALGIPLGTANTGPFAQFQNSDDEEDSLVKLVTQLVRKIPGAEPDDAVVRQQVNAFKIKVVELLKKKPEKSKVAKEEPATVVKLFEEIKVMFNDLPARLDVSGLPMKRRRFKNIPIHLMDEIIFMGHKRNPLAAFILSLSLLRDEMPWVYDYGQELIRSAYRGDANELKDVVRTFHEILEMSTHGPVARDISGERCEYSSLMEICDRLHRMVEDVPMFILRHSKGKKFLAE